MLKGKIKKYVDKKIVELLQLIVGVITKIITTKAVKNIKIRKRSYYKILSYYYKHYIKDYTGLQDYKIYLKN